MDSLVEGGVEKAVIGMPHRGRLNTLVNVLYIQYCNMRHKKTLLLHSCLYVVSWDAYLSLNPVR